MAKYGSWFEIRKKFSKVVNYEVCIFVSLWVDLVDLQNCSIPSYPNYNLNKVILTFAT